MGMQDRMDRLKDLRRRASLGGGREKIDKLHDDGYLTAEERLALLIDPGTFLEVNTFAGPQPAEFGPNPPFIPRDGVITGFGKVGGRTIGVYAHDKTVQGGSLGNVQASKIVNIIRRAHEMKVPVVALQDSVGGTHPRRKQEYRFRQRLLCGHPGFGSDSPDLGYFREMRGGGRLQFRVDGFDPHGTGQESTLHHRAGGD